MTAPRQFSAFVVRKDDEGQITTGVETLSVDQLPAGDVLVRVAWSALNYKDGLATRGHTGVVGGFPHVPGVDASGVVVESASDQFRPGDEVIITGCDLGAKRWGGWSELVRMPADSIVPLPAGLTLKESMIYGTAGFTAAQSAEAIGAHGVAPDRGPVLVTGASGGVGSMAVALLAKLGYEVVAVSGKPEAHEFLRDLGARKVIPREQVLDDSSRPLLRSQWAAAVDTVGGATLATVIRSTMHRGCVAACGLVGGADLSLTVYPFILRGVTLAGIDSEKCPMPDRRRIWSRLAGDWKLDRLEQMATRVVDLNTVGQSAQEILAGRLWGRTLLRLDASATQ